MTDSTFRPTLYLLDGCPFCFKVRLFLLEAGLAERVYIHAITSGSPEMEDVHTTLAGHLSKVSFPAAELEPGRFVADSDEIITFLAASIGTDPASLPVLGSYVAGPLKQIATLWQENLKLKASAA